MRRGRGRRFDDEPKLNMKKVIATALAFIVIILVIASIIMILKKKNNDLKPIQDVEYFAAYSNSKWTVINSKGEQLNNISYDDIITVPDSKKNVFIVTYDVDYSNMTSKTKAINENNEQLFSNYENVNAIVNYSSVDNVWYNKSVLKFSKNGKYGLIDFSGKEVLDPSYDEISSLMGIENTLITKKDGLIGLFNTSSNTTIVSPTYKEVEAFGKTYNEGYIVKSQEDSYGLIGSEGKIILEPKYEAIKKVAGDGKYVVRESGREVVISQDGTVLTNAGFDEVVAINGEDLLIKKSDRYGVITVAGEIVIDAAFDSMKHSYGEYYIVGNAGKFGVINSAKDIVIEIKYDGIDYRNDITSFVCEKDDFTTDIYGRDFTYKANGTINKVDLENGYIRFREGTEYKYYNLQWQEIASKDALKNNNLLLIKENGKYGYVNRDGAKVVDCMYDDATEQNAFGFSAVMVNGKWGALAQNGSVLVEPSIILENSVKVDFIGKWHLSEFMELNNYTK